MLFFYQNMKMLAGFNLRRGELWILKGDNIMKGYAIESGYMGYVDGCYMLFASETDYEEYVEENLA